MRRESWLSLREKVGICTNGVLILLEFWQLAMAGETAVPCCLVQKSSPSRLVDSLAYLVRLARRRRLHRAQKEELHVLNWVAPMLSLIHI